MEYCIEGNAYMLKKGKVQNYDTITTNTAKKKKNPILREEMTKYSSVRGLR